MKNRAANAGPLGRPLARAMTGALGAGQGVGATGKGIHPPPVTDFSGSPVSGGAPLSVQFTDLTTNSPQFWAWDFGDGQTSTEQNPLHVYADADIYTVSLNAANESGYDIETKADYIEATAGAATWDPAHKNANITLSGGDLIATTDQSALVAYAAVRSTTSKTAGKYVARALMTYSTDSGNEELNFGLTTVGVDVSADMPVPGTLDVLVMANDGWAYTAIAGNTNGDAGVPVVSNHYGFVFVDFDAGKVWFGNESGPQGNPEAGTGAFFTFTPNTELFLFGAGETQDVMNPVSLALDTAYSSGTFAAWD